MIQLFSNLWVSHSVSTGFDLITTALLTFYCVFFVFDCRIYLLLCSRGVLVVIVH